MMTRQQLHTKQLKKKKKELLCLMGICDIGFKKITQQTL